MGQQSQQQRNRRAAEHRWVRQWCGVGCRGVANKRRTDRTGAQWHGFLGEWDKRTPSRKRWSAAMGIS